VQYDLTKSKSPRAMGSGARNERQDLPDNFDVILVTNGVVIDGTPISEGQTKEATLTTAFSEK
jgi:hypothetical protein